MKDSRIEILEGRVAELEKLIANAPGPREDPDARTDRIKDIIMEQFHESMFKPTEMAALKCGIRKALNEFYRGPNGSNDQTARVVALQRDKEDLQRKVETLEKIVKTLEIPEAHWDVGDPVVKVSGYTFPGEVRGVIKKRDGTIVYAVEAIGDKAGNYAGMLHIFNGSQLADADEKLSL